MTSFQAGQRALSPSANVITASATFIKATGSTGVLRLLLLGILLPSVLVSGQNSTTSNTLMPSNSPTSTSQSPNSTTIITTNTSDTSVATTTDSTTNQPTMMTTGSTASTAATTNTGTTSQPPTATSTSGSTPASTTQSANFTTFGATLTAMTGGTVTGSGSTMSPSSMTSGSGAPTSMMSTPQSSETMMPNSTTIYCPSFMCNYSDCYAMYTSQNATSCSADAYCQLVRQTDMCYTVNCSAFCAERCTNESQTNCSVNCCNSTDCLNGSFAAMMMSTTTVIATTTMEIKTTPVATTAATSAQTTADNGNKCHSGTCTGKTCYKEFAKTVQTCSSSQLHCQLKKETVNSNMQWTAGCTTNCSGQTPCKTSTQPPCHLECCNATTASCLWLNGTLNVLSFATRGPHLNTELIASLICLLAITLLL
ncbi:integumentary mucin C.1 isoform X2 [Chelmon rostratus]|uniref:integumentary mucin C.1 isoform X2 n=1 Tax=Chelmon rostratus TaxID=109905 RepID=UPI001BE99396|nr:integumentary mucin C.1 isoform X2 [Chelmon rostratus]